MNEAPKLDNKNIGKKKTKNTFSTPTPLFMHCAELLVFNIQKHPQSERLN